MARPLSSTSFYSILEGLDCLHLRKTNAMVTIMLASLSWSILLLVSPPRTVVDFTIIIRSPCHRNITRAFSTAQDKQSQWTLSFESRCSILTVRITASVPYSYRETELNKPGVNYTSDGHLRYAKTEPKQPDDPCHVPQWHDQWAYSQCIGGP